jgi:hypothetical protein
VITRRPPTLATPPHRHFSRREWARKSFYARSIAAPPGSQGSHAPGSVVGMHMYASSWTNDMSATAQRMRQQAREVGTWAGAQPISVGGEERSPAGFDGWSGDAAQVWV